jgi:hypothetical protein
VPPGILSKNPSPSPNPESVRFKTALRANITGAFPQWASGLADGEALIFGPDAKGKAILVTRVKIDEPSEMLARKEAWAEAYRRTPHGKPVDLANGSS